MSFNSIGFLVFLLTAFLGFHLAAVRYRWLLLLAASLLFYAALLAPHLLLVLLLIALASYIAGKRLAAETSISRRRFWLWAGVGTNVLTLVLVKVMPFMIPTAPDSFLKTLSITIGVSYFVFQAISYLVDIYLEIADPEPHFGIFFLYLAFFPKLLQGPIERPGDLLPQLHSLPRCRYEDYRAGILLFGWGLFKKVVIADRLAMFVDPVYADVHGFTGLPLMIATYFYALQIYFDFSGYTDMALGVGRLFGVHLTQNFNAPYAATSVADFWRRWHISFSRWILDYIFKPLQMRWRDLRNYGTALALMVTFLISGVWHGLSWGFVVWGALHGLYLGTSVFYRPLQRRLHKALGLEKTRLQKVWQVFVTFHLVCFAWVFFRAASLSDALYLLTHVPADLFNQLGQLGDKEVVRRLVYLGQGSHEFIVAVVSSLAGFLLPSFGHKLSFDRRPAVVRWACYYLFVGMVLYLGVFESGNRFIYFQF